MRESALRKNSHPRPGFTSGFDPDYWAPAGVEPTVDDLMADPLTALVMRRDRIGPADVMAAVEKARDALAQRKVRSASPMPFIRPTGAWKTATPRLSGSNRLPLANAV